MFYYLAHGLSIKSIIQFPEMIQGGNGSDVKIYYGPIDIPNSDFDFKKELSRNKIFIKNGQTYIFLDDTCICKIRQGKEIVINESIKIEETHLKRFILGPGFANLLHQRRRLILHASAVNIGNTAVVFLGPRGRGKSTISLALTKRGHSLLSDDLLSILINEKDFPLVFPGFPRIKILPDVIWNIGEDPNSFDEIYLDSNKLSYKALYNFSDTPLPLKVIYYIEESNETVIEVIDPKQHVPCLMKSSFCLKIFNKKGLYENFYQCSKIANMIPLKKIRVKRSLEDLQNLVEIIEDDVKNPNL